MKEFKQMIADSIAKILIGALKQRSPILKDMIDNPSNIKVEATLKDDEILIKINKVKS